MLLFIHSNTLVLKAGIDTNIQKKKKKNSVSAGRSYKYRAKHKIKYGLGCLVTFQRACREAQHREAGPEKTSARPTLCSVPPQLFGGKGFLCPAPTKVRGERMLPTRKMDCVYNYCVLENTYSSRKHAQARSSA